MSKFTEALREIGIMNAWEFAGDGNVVISRRTAQTRACMPAHFAVWRPGYKTDPDGAWYTHGDKWFSFCGRAAAEEAFSKAKAWAGEKYGITEWAKTPFGDWMDAGFVSRRVSELKAQLKARENTNEKH